MEIFTMKKTLIALALASAMGTAAADVTVYGSVEQAVTNTDNGTTSSWDVTNSDTYVGFKSSEDLGNGMTAFANISLDLDSESGAASTTRDAYVGLAGSFGSVKLGRQVAPQKALADATIDIMEGNNSVVFANDSRLSNAVSYTTPSMSGFSAVVATVMDGANGEDTTDALEYVVSYSNGPVAAYYSVRDDKNNDVQNTIYAVSGSLADLTVAASFETQEDNDGTADVDTKTVVATYNMGNNALKVAAQRPDEGSDINAFEVAHAFSKNTTGYVNYEVSSPVSGAADTDLLSVGLRVNF
jgi:predicted porin